MKPKKLLPEPEYKVLPNVWMGPEKEALVRAGIVQALANLLARSDTKRATVAA